MFVPICNHFHTKQAIIRKIRNSKGEGYPSFTPLFERNPLTQRNEILSQ